MDLQLVKMLFATLSNRLKQDVLAEFGELGVCIMKKDGKKFGKHKAKWSLNNIIEMVRQKGKIDKVIQTMCCDNPNNWPEFLPICKMAMNALKLTATLFSPYKMLYTNAQTAANRFKSDILTHNNSVDDLLQTAKTRLREAEQKLIAAHKVSKRYYDERHGNISEYKIGNTAYILLDCRPVKSILSLKVHDKCAGPFRVTEAGKYSVALDIPPSWSITNQFSIQHLKKGLQGEDPFNCISKLPPVGHPKDSKEYWEVERILAKRTHGRHKITQYRVLWAGYSLSEATWETKERLQEDGLGDMIDEFNQVNTCWARSDGIERPVLFMSRVTTPYKANYQALELELGCLVWALLLTQHHICNCASPGESALRRMRSE